jgi:hypothetical protein
MATPHQESSTSTIHQDLDINVKKRITAFNIDYTGDYCALAG